MIGIGLALQSWLSVIVIILGFGFGLGYRIHVEEKLLVSKLGDEYIEYMNETKRLVPYIL
jgi:protein-S-isoprenylcysteine O-methyltransferase Ste14